MRRGRLAVTGAAVLMILGFGACDAGSTAPVPPPPTDVTCYVNKAGGIECPGYVFPSWITERCYVFGYDSYQCLRYAEMFGYHLP